MFEYFESNTESRKIFTGSNGNTYMTVKSGTEDPTKSSPFPIVSSDESNTTYLISTMDLSKYVPPSKIEKNSIYGGIKDLIKGLYSVFVANPMEDQIASDKLFELNIKNNDSSEEFISSNIIPSEAYQVLEKFDIEPSKLDENEKKLRLKYLDILLSLSNGEKKNPLRIPEDQKEFAIRIIKLLKSEIYPVTCPECKECQECPQCEQCQECKECPECKESVPCGECAICEECPTCKKCPEPISVDGYEITIIILVLIILFLLYKIAF